MLFTSLFNFLSESLLTLCGVGLSPCSVWHSISYGTATRNCVYLVDFAQQSCEPGTACAL